MQRFFSWVTILVLFESGLLAACSGGGEPPPQVQPLTEGGIEPGSSQSGSEPGSRVDAGGGMVLDATSLDPDANPCLGPNPPDNCRLVASGPACGDGKINQESEACDDGNSLPGDGCSGICQVEPNFVCPTEGEPCISLFACGNGQIEPGEVCDDGNTADDDGCNSTCDVQSPSFICRTPGQPCERIAFCGDGRVKGEETCDDANTNPGDGCDQNCQVEPGWVCLKPSQPCTPAQVCGDGILQFSRGEACDDGNTQDGDGCTKDCRFIEAGWECPSPGQPCTFTVVCGDGLVSGGEQCDDGNAQPGDGCSPSCQLEPGYECPFSGAPCLAKCGDGMRLQSEECDDGNTQDGDGCSATCQWEEGWACTGTPPSYECHRTTCGDGLAEGSEACDDANHDLGDGCTPFCKLEPSCPPEGGGCRSTCGDGLILPGEACDDGNAVNGDGCSSDCRVEAGFECEQPPLGDTMVVPLVVRDFRAGGDFEPGDAMGKNEAVTGLVQSTLDAQGKPVFVGSPGQGYITSSSSFAEWYRDVPGKNSTYLTTLTLFSNGQGGYVNRWKEDGTQFVNYTNISWCSNQPDCPGPDEAPVGEPGCPPPPPGDNPVCVPCAEAWGGNRTDSCSADINYHDGNPAFFPLDGATGMITPASEYGLALIPALYNGNWGEEPGGQEHNFHFTSEVRYWFVFHAGDTYVLDFTGDDDVWVFINRRLAVDLGGIHTPVSGRITLNANGTGSVVITQSEPVDNLPPPIQQTVNLGLEDGQVYEIVVFQAERKKDASTYKLTLQGFNAAPSSCHPICGDGVVTPGEQCDTGDNPGGYNQCNPDCTRGPHCGDGIAQTEYGEECDTGLNNSSYGSSGCAPGCKRPAYCGDGLVQTQFEETCDDGVNDGSYGGCTPDCKTAGYCGDGIVQPEGGELCDDGVNDGSYGNCAPGCVPGPHCGDGVTDEGFGEQCDDGNTVGGDGCSPNCHFEGGCGDAIRQDPELCDDGVNDGGYGECAPGCVPGPRCGDGALQPEYEQCDDRVFSGAYGECAPGCVFGPYCGDGTRQPGYEECDDGNNQNGDGCSAACKNEVSVPM